MSTYLALTLDPLHIGAGGYRLGRVDNTIVRDAGSGLPKVPGSSLAGVIRSYANWSLDEGETACSESNCGKCLVCKLFGFAANEATSKSQIGVLRFFDGHILAFPVRTIEGPVWVTCPEVLNANGFTIEEEPKKEEVLVNFDVSVPQGIKEARLNLGWLYMPCKKMTKPFPKLPLGSAANVLRRFVIAPDWLFSEIVNSNLEVRTSVCIDSKTGAAKEGALFTYEAIPQATLLAFTIEIDTFRSKKICSVEKIEKIIQRSMVSCATLGMGSMVTRGFGRVRFLDKA